ncbi:hypothetical protein DTL21_05440 [Bremerella cremea]|uniref:SMP-30/Gluconolactonase/LRE-like region domain-containing protein n=1 Tax=Blastopirellula marina TaxID=124 RepID=A0A2S8FYX5_9BACT|nr:MULTISPECIES: hypothetical protein [Pirellulaceae]PQO37388.1 hypothetical protein C5Y83_05440 [Blastopirellula marina]RCS49775.1 hypothetical protein DTL21_05440 [Bremerella cremea]
MPRFVGAGWVVLATLMVTNLWAQELEEPINIDEKATHEQAKLIEIPKESPVNAFCLDAKGQILAACGAGPGEVKVLDANGEQLAAWSVDIKPEAINTAPDGSILVAGHGKLMRFSPEGKLLAQAEAPHAADLESHNEELRKEAEAQVNRPAMSLGSIISAYENMIDQLEEKQAIQELNDQEIRLLQILPENIERFKKQKAEQDAAKKDAKEGEEPDNSAKIEEALKAIKASKSRVASISSDGKNVYVATPSPVGYTFDVWQTSTDFTDGKKVVSELRGCCGQMDVQACTSGIYVAENARHRVACFQPDGEMVTTWGKRDRTGADGFTSCCNPMNVCFDKTGDVYTAESNTGRIKRFAADGTFKEYIGDVKLVPGCKNVSIAISPDNDSVYMLDITRNHIVLMKRKAPSAEQEAPAATEET